MEHIAADDNDAMDLVDADDNVMGTINQADARGLLKSKAGYVRGAVAFIQNDAGKLWIPTRAANKRVAPNGLDFSVAEHVQSGETYEQGMIRGFKEELFLDVQSEEITLLGKLDSVPELPHFFMAVFMYKANEVNNYNRADFTGFQWLDPKEVVVMIDAGVPSKNALKAVIQTFDV